MKKLSASSALQNVRVLDLSRVRSGPTCVRILADFGADVIRIEPPRGVDPNEAMFAGNRLGGDFQNLNRNKRAMTLNLKVPQARPVFERLVRSADVLVENWRPAVKRRLKVDYESLRALNSRIILGSISGFGQRGPYADRPGFDQIIQGMGGLMSVTGLPGQGPVRAGLAVSDSSTGLYAAIGILIALYERERSGQGQWVHASLLHSLIAMMDFQVARYLNEGDIPGQAGNDHPTSSPMGLFQSQDAPFNLGAAGDGNWLRLCESIGCPELHEDPRFSTEPQRVQNREPLNAELNRIFATQPARHWIDLLNGAGVPAGQVYSVPQVLEDPQVKFSGVAKEIVSDGHRFGFVTQPVILERTPAEIVREAPAWGADTDDIMQELGYEASEIRSLRECGAI